MYMVFKSQYKSKIIMKYATATGAQYEKAMVAKIVPHARNPGIISKKRYNSLSVPERSDARPT
jgi:hypothetical protein